MVFQRVLVPVDFSECSWSALLAAADLCRRTGGQIDLIHVWEPPAFLPPESIVGTVGTPSLPLVDVIRGNAETAMREFLARASDRDIRVREGRVLLGEPARTIVEQARGAAYDLIVIGTHGRTGLSHLLLGSVAEKVVRLAPVPVLTVRDAGVS